MKHNHYEQAARHYEEAAKHHHEAHKLLQQGDDDQASRHALAAHGHAVQAYDATKEAAKKHSEQFSKSQSAK